MKIYTKTGDDGTTGLVDGSRVAKSDPRVECFGVIDELNAAIGLAAVVAAPPLLDPLRAVQADLFVLGAHVGTPHSSSRQNSLPPLDESIVFRLEKQIDLTTARLPALRNFILPGGSELAARLQVARTICRRAERLVVALGTNNPERTRWIRYLNRLSDWLFTEARHANQAAGVQDVIWQPTQEANEPARPTAEGD